MALQDGFEVQALEEVVEDGQGGHGVGTQGSLGQVRDSPEFVV
jgi:hypothetical protein